MLANVNSKYYTDHGVIKELNLHEAHLKSKLSNIKIQNNSVRW